MTREEAIKYLKILDQNVLLGDKIVEAVYMAISALEEQKPREVGTQMSLPECEDAVSRLEALDAINDYINTVGVLDGYTDTQEVRHIIKRLPSVKPKPSQEELDSAYAHGYTYAESEFHRWKEEHMLKPGKWIIVTGERHMRWRECSECHGAYDIHYAYKFCPKCGARMDGGQDAKTV